MKKWRKERVVEESYSAIFTLFFEAISGTLVVLTENVIHEFNIMIGVGLRKIVLLANLDQVLKSLYYVP